MSDFSDRVRPATLIVTIAATGVPQKVSATSLLAKSVAIERITDGSTGRIGDATNQVLSSLVINANNQWVDLSSLYVKGTLGDQFGVLYSITFK